MQIPHGKSNWNSLVYILKLIIAKDTNGALLMKGICLIWSRDRHFSPSLPVRGPTGIWNSAHSISDPRAEISGILVTVRRSSATSRGTTYWFLIFFAFFIFRLSVSRVFRLRKNEFSRTEAYTIIKRKKSVLDGTRETEVSTWWWAESREYPGTSRSNVSVMNTILIQVLNS